MKLVTKNNGLFLYDGTTVAAYLTWSMKDNAMLIEHTYVSPAYRGQGLAGRLVEEALGKAEAEGREAVPICSYARSYIEKKEGRKAG